MKRDAIPGTQLAGGAVLAVGLAAIYAGTLSAPFTFDDRSAIVGNASLRHLWPLTGPLRPPADAVVGGRPLLNLSYALNFAGGGTAVAGYHVANLLVHLLAAWTLFALLRRTLLQPVLAGRFGSSATAVALAAAALWAWHPLLTESVTYLSQRAESLMGLCYLLTLYGFIRYAADGTTRWAVVSVLACLAGVATKEVIVTAPVLVLLYDRTFVSGSFGAAWRRHGRLHAALAATWVPLGFLLGDLHRRGVGFGQGIAWWTYAATECRGLIKYLLLCFWPRPLVFDYGLHVSVPLPPLGVAAAVLGLVLALTVVAVRRWPPAGFAACWFFLILAPTSSVVPVAGQPLAENRLYLPLAGVAALTVGTLFAAAGRRALVLFAALAVILGVATAARNRAYASEETLWRDTLAKNPENPRVHNNLGFVLEAIPGRLPEAIGQFEEALRLQPNYAEAHNNLGIAWSRIPGKDAAAAAEYAEALRLKPDYAEARFNLGDLWLNRAGGTAEAIAQYREALRLRPDFVEAHNNLGGAWARQPGHLPDALREFAEAVRLRPDYAEAQVNLGAALLRTPGRAAEARAHLAAALRLRPGEPTATRLWAQLPGPATR